MILEALLVIVVLALIGLAVLVVLLARRLWQLMASVECLCSNLDGLRAQIGHGGHGHG